MDPGPIATPSRESDETTADIQGDKNFSCAFNADIIGTCFLPNRPAIRKYRRSGHEKVVFYLENSYWPVPVERDKRSTSSHPVNHDAPSA